MTDVRADGTRTPVQSSSPRRAVAAGGFGAALENYDYSIYGFLATTIVVLFFPPGNESAALLATWAGFSAGFLARPIGGLFFGFLGDRIGRRNTLVIMILVMSLATVLVGLLPTYARIGLLASVLLFALRLLQGFASGGDGGNSIAFMVEYAPEGRRGFYGSWQQVALVGGVVMASLVGAIMSNLVSEEAFTAWAWRVPFLLAFLVGAFGLYLRLTVRESPQFEAAAEDNQVTTTPIRDALTRHWKPTLVMTGIYQYWVVLSVTLGAYAASYMVSETGLRLSQALIANTIALGVMLAVIPFMGGAVRPGRQKAHDDRLMRGYRTAGFSDVPDHAAGYAFGLPNSASRARALLLLHGGRDAGSVRGNVPNRGPCHLAGPGDQRRHRRDWREHAVGLHLVDRRIGIQSSSCLFPGRLRGRCPVADPLRSQREPERATTATF
jgi:MFS family permease